MNDTNIDEHSPIFEELHRIIDVSIPHTTSPSPTNTDENV
jgi:hypothetical protein